MESTSGTEKSSVLPDGVLGSGGHTHRAPPCGLDTCTAMLRTLTPFAFITQLFILHWCKGRFTRRTVCPQPAHHVFVRHQIERRAVGPLTGLPRKFKCLSPRGN
ncbi:uncharacterized protein LOC144093953 isoform X1 [Amblyomma americanum]